MAKVRRVFHALSAVLAIHSLTRGHQLHAMDFEKGLKQYSISNDFLK